MRFALSMLVTIFAWSSAISCFGVRRSVNIPEPPLVEAGRNMVIGGWAILALRCSYLMVIKETLPWSPLALIAMVLIGGGTTFVCMGMLMASKFDTPCIGCKYNNKES